MFHKKKGNKRPTDGQPPKPSKPSMTRGRALGLLGLAGVVGLIAVFGLGLLQAVPAAAAEVVIYKSPECGCCGKWARHLEGAGFTVKIRNVEDMEPIKRRAGVTDELISCHTAFTAGYVIEGHVPAPSLHKLLAERPDIRGLAVPGMPMGAPGMDGGEREPYEVLSFAKGGKVALYARY